MAKKTVADLPPPENILDDILSRRLSLAKRLDEINSEIVSIFLQMDDLNNSLYASTNIANTNVRHDLKKYPGYCIDRLEASVGKAFESRGGIRNSMAHLLTSNEEHQKRICDEIRRELPIAAQRSKLETEAREQGVVEHNQRWNEQAETSPLYREKQRRLIDVPLDDGPKAA